MNFSIIATSIIMAVLQCAPAFAQSPERVLLLTELSDSYKINRQSVERQPDINKLNPLLASPDPQISKMAKVASTMIFMMEATMRQSDIAPEIRKMRREIIEFTIEEIITTHPDAADSLRSAVATFASADSAFPQALAKMREAYNAGTQIHRIQNAYRDEMKQYLETTTPRNLQAGSRVTVRLGSPGGNITPTTPGLVVIKNMSPQSLSGACVVIDIHPDRQRLAKLAAEVEQKIRFAGAIQEGLGADPGMVEDQLKIHRRQTEIHEMGKGTFVYVGEWPTGSEVSVHAELLGDIESFAGRIDVHVFADQGRFPIQTLEGDDMRQLIWKIDAKQKGR